MLIALRPIRVVLLIVMLVHAADCRAQTSGKPFDTVRVGISVFGDLGDGALQQYWAVQPGIHAFVEAPFHAGIFHGGFYLNRFAGRSAGQPDFTGANIWAGYGFRVRMPANVNWMIGGHLGAFQMVFDGVTGSMRWETEIAAGARTRISIPITRAVNADAGFSYFRVFTSTRIDLFYPSAGISYSFASPQWLRNFLR